MGLRVYLYGQHPLCVHSSLCVQGWCTDNPVFVHLERFSFVCTVSTDHRQAIAEADRHDPAQCLYSASRLLHTAEAVRTTLRSNMSYFHTMRHKVLSLIESPRKAQKEAKLAAACMRGDI